MSALAWILHDQGLAVRGSDLRENARTRGLRAAGVPVHRGHDPAHLEPPALVVYSSAVRPDNVELRAARAAGCPVHHRQELLAALLALRRAIGVAGTHGKTTTTAMVAALLGAAGLDPAYLIGAPTPTLGERHARWGDGEWLVAEIDESDGHFTRFRTEIAVVTNVGLDHLSHYRSEAALVAAFARFVARSRVAVLSADDPHTPALARHAKRALTFGVSGASAPSARARRPPALGADLVAYDVEQHRLRTRARLVFRGEAVGELELNAPGVHNVRNALAALLVGHLVGLDFGPMLRTLRRFRLPERRFQILEENGVVVVDDYAHLPEQIEMNLEAARRGWRPRRVIAVFQPHRYTRLSYLNGHFPRALRRADWVLVTDIYPAFEDPIPGVDARRVVDALEREHARVHYAPSAQELYEFLSRRVEPGDFVIGFGPGDVWQALHRLAREARKGR